MAQAERDSTEQTRRHDTRRRPLPQPRRSPALFCGACPLSTTITTATTDSQPNTGHLVLADHLGRLAQRAHGLAALGRAAPDRGADEYRRADWWGCRVCARGGVLLP